MSERPGDGKTVIFASLVLCSLHKAQKYTFLLTPPITQERQSVKALSFLFSQQTERLNRNLSA